MIAVSKKDTKGVLREFLQSYNNALKTFHCITSLYQVDPYVMFKTVPKNGNPLVAKENLEGFCIDLAEAVSQQIGFDYIIRFVKDNSYGGIMKNGTWNGMVGELSRHVGFLLKIYFEWNMEPHGRRTFLLKEYIFCPSPKKFWSFHCAVIITYTVVKLKFNQFFSYVSGNFEDLYKQRANLKMDKLGL